VNLVTVGYLVVASVVCLSGCQKQMTAGIAEDQIGSYEMAKRSGDKMQVCAQAQLIEQIYLQAKDETNYQKWQQVSKADCKVAQDGIMKDAMKDMPQL
jgi:hypothetical protein